MTETNTNQDACQGKTLTIDWSAGSGLAGGGPGGGTPANTVLGDCRWDDGSINPADTPAVGPHTLATCSGGVVAVTCLQGFVDIDGNPLNGCEVDIAGSSGGSYSLAPASCPAVPPSIPHATSSCTNATVTWSCVSGFVDLNGIVDDGCETALVSFTRPAPTRLTTVRRA
jgi:hypothetical protein